MNVRLADFIRGETELIIQEWESFAKTLLNASSLNKTELRGHAEKMLLKIADDLDASQTKSEQKIKSKGLAHNTKDTSSAAVEHGGERHDSGFDVVETVSEFRALRASVESLWAETQPTLAGQHREDMKRFHEAIDQSLAESIEEFARLKERDTGMFEAVLTASPDPIFVLDIQGNVRYANEATADLFNLEPHAIIGESIFQREFLFDSDFRRRVKNVITKQRSFRGKFVRLSEDSQKEKYDYHLVPVVDKTNKVNATVCISRDITLAALHEEQVWHDAHYDELTGLANRRLFTDRLQQEVKRAKRNKKSFGVLFLDLNGFKEVNDSFGHEAGDLVLRTVAERISSCVREVDTIARMGGDEFTVILTQLKQPKNAQIVAQSIIDAIALPFAIGHRAVYISTSIGISYYGEETSSPAELLKAADDAMYKAKEADSAVRFAHEHLEPSH